MVDLEQEVLRLKDENSELKERAKAWDDLNELISSDKGPLLIGFAKYNDEPLIKYNDFYYECNSIIDGVSRALESIKGES